MPGSVKGQGWEDIETHSDIMDPYHVGRGQWVWASRGQNGRLEARITPVWQEVGVSVGLPCLLRGVLSTGFSAHLDEELQSTLHDFRRQIVQSLGGKGTS